MSEARQPDRLERRLRFGCGSVVGLLLGVVIATQLARPDWSLAIIVVPIGLGCGLLAARFGDAFWRYVIEAFTWFV